MVSMTNWKKDIPNCQIKLKNTASTAEIRRCFVSVKQGKLAYLQIDKTRVNKYTLEKVN